MLLIICHLSTVFYLFDQTLVPCDFNTRNSTSYGKFRRTPLLSALHRYNNLRKIKLM